MTRKDTVTWTKTFTDPGSTVREVGYTGDAGAARMPRVTFDPPVHMDANTTLSLPVATATFHSETNSWSLVYEKDHFWVKHRNWGWLPYWTKHRIIHERDSNQ